MTGLSFWQYWYFHLPNFVMAALIYTLLGRFALSFFLPPDSSNYIWRWFCRLTDWTVRAATIVTPRYVMFLFLPLIAACWLSAMRVAFMLVMARYGWLPDLEAAS